MHSIHLHDVHAPKGPNLFLLSVGALSCFSIALISFVIAYMVGGDGYAAILGGSITLTVLALGVVGSTLCLVMTRPEDTGEDKAD